MNKTIVIYGSSTGTCESIAEKIAQKLGCEALNVQELTADVISENQNLILGTSTGGAGELQYDWYDGGSTDEQRKAIGRPLPCLAAAMLSHTEILSWAAWASCTMP